MPAYPFDYPAARLSTRYPNRRFTYRSLWAVIGETKEPHELWEGRLVCEPPPTVGHQRAVLWLAFALKSFAEPKGLGVVVTSPVAMVLSPDTFVEPDVAFIATPHLERVKRNIEGPADLVAEVLSPGNRRKARDSKRKLYEQCGVQEYWIIDPKRQTVEVLTREAQGQFRSLGLWGPGQTARSALLPEFEIRIPLGSVISQVRRPASDARSALRTRAARGRR